MASAKPAREVTRVLKVHEMHTSMVMLLRTGPKVHSVGRAREDLAYELSEKNKDAVMIRVATEMLEAAKKSKHLGTIEASDITPWLPRGTGDLKEKLERRAATCAAALAQLLRQCGGWITKKELMLITVTYYSKSDSYARLCLYRGIIKFFVDAVFRLWKRPVGDQYARSVDCVDRMRSACFESGLSESISRMLESEEVVQDGDSTDDE